MINYSETCIVRGIRDFIFLLYHYTYYVVPTTEQVVLIECAYYRLILLGLF